MVRFVQRLRLAIGSERQLGIYRSAAELSTVSGQPEREGRVHSWRSSKITHNGLRDLAFLLRPGPTGDLSR